LGHGSDLKTFIKEDVGKGGALPLVVRPGQLPDRDAGLPATPIPSGGLRRVAPIGQDRQTMVPTTKEVSRMRRLLARVPSPAATLAFIALVAALSGSAIALPGTGSVDSGDIKNNSVGTKDLRNNHVRSNDVRNNSLTGGDVRNNSLTGGDVRNNSLTGNDVNESTFGKVPSAGSADNAANAANATNAANAAAVGGFRVVRVDPFTLIDGQTKDILQRGPFTFTARCRINFDPEGFGELRDLGQILIATSQDNAVFDGDDGGELDIATPEDDRDFLELTQFDVGAPAFDSLSDGAALATDGTEIVGSELYVGVNVLNQPGTCRFGGFFMIA
jgi:hypothetical protein